MTREQLEALPADEFDKLFRLVGSINMARMGKRHTGNRPSPEAAQMATMAAGDSILFPWRHIHCLSTHRREGARKLLGDPQAHWTGRTTNQGIRVTRIR